MGIYDRDYLRREPPPGMMGGGALGARMGGPRTWSANTWLIVICIAVFVIDGFLPPRLVPRTIRYTSPEASLVEPGLIGRGEVLTIRDPYGAIVGAERRYVLTENPQVVIAVEQFHPMSFLQSYLHFSTSRGLIQQTPDGRLVGFEFWRLIGFQFLHAGVGHLLFNMLGLFFFGSLVERHLGSKRYLAFYLLSGIFGALMYMALNLTGVLVKNLSGSASGVPFLLFNDPSTPLIGASAGVFGVLMAGAYLAPRATVLLFFILPVQLRTVAYGLVILALLTLFRSGPNAGGEAAHLGGALAGFYFIRRPHHLHNFFDVLGRVDPTSHHYRRKKKAGALIRSAQLASDRAVRSPGKSRAASARQEKQVDAILDKIKREGIGSLTDKEKRLLSEASKE